MTSPIQPLNKPNPDIKPTRKKSNQMDKICSKLQISVKNINNDNTLTKSNKLKIQKYIEKDDIQHLQQYLDNKVLNYQIEIGIQSMKWNVIHFAAKNNSIKTLTVILAKTYQETPHKYTELINSKTSDGYTPLMITIIYCSRQAFRLLLSYGGIDIHEVDNKGMTAYDLALNYKNEMNIKELMIYQNLNKKKDSFINQELLMKPIDPLIYSESVNCYSKVIDYFTDCFICFNKEGVNQNDQFQTKPSDDPQNQLFQQQQQPQQQQSFLRKSLNGSKLKSLLNYMQDSPFVVNIDKVAIGNSQIESKYSIQWRKLTSTSNQKPVLFDCFQPFDICQNNLIIANSLIIFQCLSDHTWLVRKILKPIKKGQLLSSVNKSDNGQQPNQYTIQVYINDQIKKITVDENIPFLKERQQPMFLSNLNQMWPPILQKGLAKIYGSYMKLSEIKPQIFLQNFTGAFTKKFQLTEGINFLKQQHGQFIKQKQIMPALQDFSAKGYMMVLQGRQGTSLCPKNTPTSFKTYTYNLLNFYQKGNKRLILVNCPYVLNSWKQKQKNQIMQLKLIKSHYNTHNQMCVWIQQNQFCHFFKNVIVSFVQPNLNRTQLKIRYLVQNNNTVDKRLSSNNNKLSILENITNSAKSIFSSSRVDNHNELNQPKQTTNTKQRDSILSNTSQCIKKSKRIQKLIFIKFTIQTTKNSQTFSLTVKDNITHKLCKINKFKGFINNGNDSISLDDGMMNVFSKDLIRIKQQKGQYLCMFEVEFDDQEEGRRQSYTSSSFRHSQCMMKENKEDKENQPNKIQKQQSSSIVQLKKIKKHQLLVLCWSQDSIHLEHIEQEFAILEWIQSWRNNCIKNWMYMEKMISSCVNTTQIKQNKQNYSCKNDQNSEIKYLAQKIGSKLSFLSKSSQRNLTLTFLLKCNKAQVATTKQSIKNMIFQGQIADIQQLSNDKQQKDNSSHQLIQIKVNINMIRDNDHNQFQYVILGGNQLLVNAFISKRYIINYSQ